MAETFPELLAMGDVTEMLDVSAGYVHQLIDEGKLRSQRTSAGYIFLKSDVVTFKKDRERRAKSDPRIRIRK